MKWNIDTNCASVTQVTAKTKEEAIAKLKAMTQEQLIRKTKVYMVCFDYNSDNFNVEPAE